MLRVLKVVVAIVGGLFVLGLIVGATGNKYRPAVASNGVQAVVAAPSTPTATAPPAAVPVPVPVPEIKLPETLAEAIDQYKPMMDEQADTSSSGTVMLSLWSGGHLAWGDVALKANETSLARARKDIDAERGKRMCSGGRLIEIKKEDTTAGLPKVFSGLLMSEGGLLHFYTVRSTGTLLERDYGRFCGVVTGLFDYHNSGGGVGHAIDVVGMFDLPENRGAAK